MILDFMPRVRSCPRTAFILHRFVPKLNHLLLRADRVSIWCWLMHSTALLLLMAEPVSTFERFRKFFAFFPLG